MKIGLALVIAVIAMFGQCASLQHKQVVRHSKHKAAHRVHKTIQDTEPVERTDSFYFSSPTEADPTPEATVATIQENKTTPTTPTPTPPKPPKERPKEPF